MIKTYTKRKSSKANQNLKPEHSQWDSILKSARVLSTLPKREQAGTGFCLAPDPGWWSNSDGTSSPSAHLYKPLHHSRAPWHAALLRVKKALPGSGRSHPTSCAKGTRHSPCPLAGRSLWPQPSVLQNLLGKNSFFWMARVDWVEGGESIQVMTASGNHVHEGDQGCSVSSLLSDGLCVHLSSRWATVTFRMMGKNCSSPAIYFCFWKYYMKQNWGITSLSFFPYKQVKGKRNEFCSCRRQRFPTVYYRYSTIYPKPYFT